MNGTPAGAVLHRRRGVHNWQESGRINTTVHLNELEFLARRRGALRFRLLREWCFVRAAARHFRWRLLVLLVVLVGGGLLFQHYEPEKNLSLAEAAYYTWSLVFGEPPEAFPKAHALRLLFFLVPVLGFTVIIEGMIDFAFLLRDRRRYERSWCKMMAASLSNHIVIVGFGRLGYRIFRVLRRLGEPIVVIEREANNRFLEEVRRDGSPLIIGDARDDTVLEEANVASARSVVIAMDDDLANLEVALDSRRLRPGIGVVLRMFDQNMADKIREGFDIHLAMSQSAQSAPAFATAAIDPSIVSSFSVDDELVVMQQWSAREGGPLAGKTVGQIMTDLGCGVTRLRSGREDPRLFPSPDTRVKAGDELLVQGPFSTMAKLKADGRQ